MSVNDGGPAFPVAVPNPKDFPEGYACPGMSLRDWFAGMAMQSLIGWARYQSDASRKIAAEMASQAYSYADAMIAERGNNHEHS